MMLCDLLILMSICVPALVLQGGHQQHIYWYLDFLCVHAVRDRDKGEPSEVTGGRKSIQFISRMATFLFWNAAAVHLPSLKLTP